MLYADGKDTCLALVFAQICTSSRTYRAVSNLQGSKKLTVGPYHQLGLIQVKRKGFSTGEAESFYSIIPGVVISSEEA